MNKTNVTKGWFSHMAKVNKGLTNKFPNRGKGKPVNKAKFFSKKSKNLAWLAAKS